MRELTWPASRLGEAVEALASRCGLLEEQGSAGAPPAHQGGDVDSTVARCAEALGLEAEPVSTSVAALPRWLRGASPALLAVGGEGTELGILAIAGAGGRRVRLLTPDHRTARPRVEAVAEWVAQTLDSRRPSGGAGLADWVGSRIAKPERVVAALERAHVRHARIDRCWLLRRPPYGSFWRQARREGLLSALVQFVLVYAVSYSLFLLSWAFLGRAALSGRLEGGWLGAWAVTLLALLPIRVWSIWSRVRLAVGAGSLIKRRLLAGVQRLDGDLSRREGAGQLLGRVLEAQEVEGKTLDGGFLAVVGVIQTVLSAVVLAQGSAPAQHLLALALWSGLAALACHRYFTDQLAWARARIRQTHDLVEGMVGYRTRLAQQTVATLHRDEEPALESYRLQALRMDGRKSWLLAVVPRGWLLVGLAVLAPQLVSGGGSLVPLAIGIGGVLAAFRGFGKLAEGVGHLSGAAVAWHQIRDLFAAAAVVPEPPAAEVVAGIAEGVADPGSPALEMAGVTYRHRGRATPTLQRCSFSLESGERILVRGRSGGGKSTLASLCAGLRSPDEGLILHRGLDARTLAGEWRRRLTLVPQFHENHVFCESLAFNLLLGRRWPPAPGDLDLAAQVCEELGLGELLSRMPAGLHQVVGETGWQLSHGECARVFLARALLQEGEVLLLDESFDALDPGTLDTVLTAVLARARSVVFLAHP